MIKTGLIQGDYAKFDQKVASAIVKEMEPAYKSAFEHHKKVVEKHGDKNPMELSLALQTSLQHFFQQICGNQAVHMLIELLHSTNTQVAAQQALTPEQHARVVKERNEKPSYVG